MEVQESIYGAHRPALEKVMDGIMKHIGEIRAEMEQKLSMDPVEHCLFPKRQSPRWRFLPTRSV